MIKQNFFENIDTESKAYWLGFLFADGYIDKKNNYCQLILAIKDSKHAQKLAKEFNRVYTESDTSIRVMLYGKELCKNLIDKGVINKKSLVDNDSIFSFIPENLMHHFIRGYFDGDGYVGILKGGECRVVVCGMKKFLMKFKSIIEENCHTENGCIYPAGKIYKFAIGSRNNLISIRDWLYKDCSICLKRKQDIFYNIFPNGTSKYKGVHWCNTKKKWLARYTAAGKTKTIGQFTTEIDARLAYIDATNKG